MSINNLRIGTKLAIASGLAILLVAGMLFTQWQSDASVGEATHASVIYKTPHSWRLVRKTISAVRNCA